MSFPGIHRNSLFEVLTANHMCWVCYVRRDSVPHKLLLLKLLLYGIHYFVCVINVLAEKVYSCCQIFSDDMKIFTSVAELVEVERQHKKTLATAPNEHANGRWCSEIEHVKSEIPV